MNGSRNGDQRSVLPDNLERAAILRESKGRQQTIENAGGSLPRARGSALQNASRRPRLVRELYLHSSPFSCGVLCADALHNKE